MEFSNIHKNIFNQSLKFDNLSINNLCSLSDNLKLYSFNLTLENLTSKTEYTLILIVRYYSFYGEKQLFELKINQNFTTKEKPIADPSKQQFDFIFIILIFMIILFLCCVCAFCAFIGLVFFSKYKI